MKISCFTNLDDYQRERWPTSTCGEPRVGDGMKAESGRCLKVVARTWLPDGSLRIELHYGRSAPPPPPPRLLERGTDQ